MIKHLLTLLECNALIIEVGRLINGQSEIFSLSSGFTTSEHPLPLSDHGVAGI